MSNSQERATELLHRICSGESGLADELFPLVYDQLHALAASMLRRERADHTLQATALVHEAYMRLLDADDFDPDEGAIARQHYVALAARAMRRILVEHARSRGRDKRGGGLRRVTLDEAHHAVGANDIEVLDLENALARMEKIDERLVRAAELRLFGGLSVREMAPCLGISSTRAKVVWASARAMLNKLLHDDEDVSVSAAESQS